MFNWLRTLLQSAQPVSTRLIRPQLPCYIRWPDEMIANPVVWTHPDGFVIRNGDEIFVRDLDLADDYYFTWRREEGLDCLWGIVVFKTHERACKIAAEQKVVLEGYKVENQARLDKWLRDQQHVSQMVECC